MKKQIIGWREWIRLPDLGVSKIKAKIDTGAKSSSLHAFDLEIYSKGSKKLARFVIHPLQKNTTKHIKTEAEIIDIRKIKSSTGHIETRPLIITNIELMGHIWPIEITLARRDDMGFRMLLGRQAIRDLFLINPARSFLAKKQKKHNEGDL